MGGGLQGRFHGAPSRQAEQGLFAVAPRAAPLLPLLREPTLRGARPLCWSRGVSVFPGSLPLSSAHRVAALPLPRG